MEVPHDFFTRESIVTFSGAVGITFVVSNAIQKAFDFNPKWFALFIAVIICMIGSYLMNGGVLDYFLAFINGCLVFLAAAGGSQAVGKPPEIKFIHDKHLEEYRPPSPPSFKGTDEGMEPLGMDFATEIQEAQSPGEVKQEYTTRGFFTRWF